MKYAGDTLSAMIILAHPVYFSNTIRDLPLNISRRCFQYQFKIVSTVVTNERLVTDRNGDRGSNKKFVCPVWELYPKIIANENSREYK